MTYLIIVGSLIFGVAVAYAIRWLQDLGQQIERGPASAIMEGELDLEQPGSDAVVRAPYPHCDSKVLHAPGKCVYCDEFPEYHEVRRLLGINFTGEHDPTKRTCPSELARPLETIERWGGNRAMTQAEIDEESAAWRRLAEQYAKETGK